MRRQSGLCIRYVSLCKKKPREPVPFAEISRSPASAAQRMAVRPSGVRGRGCTEHWAVAKVRTGRNWVRSAVRSSSIGLRRAPSAIFCGRPSQWRMTSRTRPERGEGVLAAMPRRRRDKADKVRVGTAGWRKSIWPAVAPDKVYVPA